MTATFQSRPCRPIQVPSADHNSDATQAGHPHLRRFSACFPGIQIHTLDKPQTHSSTATRPSKTFTGSAQPISIGSRPAKAPSQIPSRPLSSLKAPHSCQYSCPGLSRNIPVGLQSLMHFLTIPDFPKDVTTFRNPKCSA